MKRSNWASGNGYVPSLLDWILRGGDKEWLFQRIGLPADGHVPLGHGFQ